MANFNVNFDSNKNVYNIQIGNIKEELSREDAVKFQRDLTSILKKTPLLINIGNEQTKEIRNGSI